MSFLEYILFFNKNIEAEIARKIRTLKEQSEAEIFFQQTNISPRRQCKANDSFQISGSLLYSLSDIYITLKLQIPLRLLAFALTS